MPGFNQMGIGEFKAFSQREFVRRHTTWTDPDPTRRAGAWAVPERYRGSCEGMIVMYVKADCSLDAFLATNSSEALATIRGFQNLHNLVYRDNFAQLDTMAQEVFRLNGNWKLDAPPTRRLPVRSNVPSQEEFSSRVVQAVGPRWMNPDPAVTTKLVIVNIAFRVPGTAAPSSSAGAPVPSDEHVGHAIAIRREGNLCRVFDPNLGEASQLPIEHVRAALRALLSHYVTWSLVGWKIALYRR